MSENTSSTLMSANLRTIMNKLQFLNTVQVSLDDDDDDDDDDDESTDAEEQEENEEEENHEEEDEEEVNTIVVQPQTICGSNSSSSRSISRSISSSSVRPEMLHKSESESISKSKSESDEDKKNEYKIDSHNKKNKENYQQRQQQQQQQHQPHKQNVNEQNDLDEKCGNGMMTSESGEREGEIVGGSFNQFAPLTIQTEIGSNINNELDPTEQIFDLANKLDQVSKERKDLNEKYEKLRTEQSTSENKIEMLAERNDLLQERIHSLTAKVRLQEANKQSRGNDESESLTMMTQKVDKLQRNLTNYKQHSLDLEKQVVKLRKYESLFKKNELCQVGKNLYQQVQKIGAGGFSEVFHCISFNNSKSYALKKVNLAQLDESNTALILKEIEVLKKLQSSSKVVKLVDYELHKEQKLLNVVMELGSTDLSVFLKKEIGAHKRALEPTRSYYWMKMLEAVQSIHELGVIHFDLKPSNFIVVGCEVKLIDFNISNNMDMERTSMTMACDCGTLNYMAPEQITKDSNSKTKVNQKVDVWAMGVILYLMAYGRLPLQHIKNTYQMIFALTDPEKKEFKFGPLEDPKLKDTLDKCLCHNPRERHSIGELLSHPYLTDKK